MISINWPATKAKFDEKFSQAKVARGIGVNKVTFSRILNGKYPHLASATAETVLTKLKELDVLVVVTNDAA